MNAQEYKKRIDEIMIGPGSLDEKKNMVATFKNNTVVTEVPSYKAVDQDPLTKMISIGINWYLMQGVAALVVTGCVFIKLNGGSVTALPLVLFGGGFIFIGLLISKNT